MNMTFKKIYRQIKKHDTIVIGRHVGPDPDALASQIALRDTIINNFPNKKVYAVGGSASKFKYLGTLDRIEDVDISNALLIVTDVPDKRRVDVANIDQYKTTIKIDHHPFVEEFCDIEYVDETATSACQILIDFLFSVKLKITKEAAEKLFLGVISDSNRFLYSYTTTNTFDLVSKLIKTTNIDFTSLYSQLYLRPIEDYKFQNYILNNFKITENGLASLILTDEILKKYNMDAATAGNMIGNFNYIDEIYTWVIFSYDAANENYRGSIRSRGPIINDIAAKYNGGGHPYASGIRIKDEEKIEKVINDLDDACKKYKANF